MNSPQDDATAADDGTAGASQEFEALEAGFPNATCFCLAHIPSSLLSIIMRMPTPAKSASYFAIVSSSNPVASLALPSHLPTTASASPV